MSEENGTPQERAGRVQRLVVEEAKRLDAVSRDRLAAALWRSVDRAGDDLAAAVDKALAYASWDGYDDKSRARAREEYQKIVDALPLSFERFQWCVLIAQMVSPPGQPGPPMREVDLHSP